MKSFTKYLFLFGMALCPFLVFSQPDIKWQFAVEAPTFPAHIFPTSDGQILLTYHELFHLDTDGEVVSEENMPFSGLNYATQISNGKIVAYSGGFQRPMYLNLLSPEGDLIWRKEIEVGFFANGMIKIVELPNGDLVAAGTIPNSGSSVIADYFLLKFNASGDMLWSKNYGEEDLPNVLYDFELLPDGGFLLTGQTFGSGSLVIKTDTNGDILWSTSIYPSERLELEESVIGRDGDLYFAGYIQENGGDLLIIKMDPQGNINWEKTFGGNNREFFSDLLFGEDNHLLLVGYSTSIVSGNKSSQNLGNRDFWFAKVDLNGNKIWDYSYGGSDHDMLIAVKQTADEGCLLLGRSNSEAGGNKESSLFGAADVWLVKTDKDGIKKWDQSFGGDMGDVVSRTRTNLDHYLFESEDGKNFIVGSTSRSGISGNKTIEVPGSDELWLVGLDINTIREDTESPVISEMPADIEVNTEPGKCTAVVSWPVPEASDNVEVLSFTASHTPGDAFPAGTTVVSYTATDAASNVTNANFEILVKDEEAPVVRLKPATLDLNQQGTVLLNFSNVNDGTSDNCGFGQFLLSEENFSCEDVGTHNIEVTAIDKSGNTAVGQTTVTIQDPNNYCAPPVENEPPVAHAGADQTLMDTDESGDELVSLDASDSHDPDGSIVSYSWTIGGTEIATGAGPAVSLPVGSSTVLLTVTDNEGAQATDEVVITISVPQNKNPVADAGEDQMLIDADDDGEEEVELNAGGSTDPDGTIISYTWSIDANEIDTGMNPTVMLPVGFSTVILTVTDNDGAQATDEITITINAPENEPPVAHAGADQSLMDTDESGDELVRLDASDSYDVDGSILSYSWSTNANEIATGLNPSVSLPVGVHMIMLTVTDNEGALDTDEVMIIIESDIDTPQNQSPIISAGKDRTVILPVDWLRLSGTGYDPDGRFTAFLWEKISGPSLTMDRANTANLELSDLEEGMYTFRFSATDNAGATSSDDVMLEVLEAGTVLNKKPQVNAGADKEVALPANTAFFIAAAYDPDGTIVSYQWEQLSGSAATLHPIMGNTLSVSDLTAGTYTFSITVTDDDGATATDQVNLRVNGLSPDNQAPVISAGRDREVWLPVNSLVLTGNGYDLDGRFSAFLWEKISGPSVAMHQQGTANLELSELEEGVYAFRFSATDNAGATVSNEMMLTVNAALHNNNIAISAYPNTFDQHINLKVEAKEPLQYDVTVYDVIGKVVYRGHFTSALAAQQDQKIDFFNSHLKGGVYLMQIAGHGSQNFSKTIRIVKR